MEAIDTILPSTSRPTSLAPLDASVLAPFKLFSGQIALLEQLEGSSALLTFFVLYADRPEDSTQCCLVIWVEIDLEVIFCIAQYLKRL